jgi:capsular exopolysaccharide synthesis family protein
MSRIDEALKRVAGKIDRLVNSDSVAVEERRPHLVDTSVLERYALETPLRSAESLRGQPVRHPEVTPSSHGSGPVKRFHQVQSPKLVVNRDIAPGIIEQYRRLAATLHDLQTHRGLKSLMITSAAAHEGKTLTTANLGLTLSESYRRRVLLIDADLRHPSLHEVFEVSNRTGLGDLLRSSDDLEKRLVELSSHLSVLPAGRPDSTPLAELTSERFNALLKDAAARFDWIILDTPPLDLLSDARLVARVCDGVLFVIAAGSTSYEIVQRCMAELGPDRLIGTVLNRAQQTTADHHYYGHYYPTHV